MRHPKLQVPLAEVFARMESAGLSGDVQVIRDELRRLRLRERERRLIARDLANELSASGSTSKTPGGPR